MASIAVNSALIGRVSRRTCKARGGLVPVARARPLGGAQVPEGFSDSSARPVAPQGTAAGKVQLQLTLGRRPNPRPFRPVRSSCKRQRSAPNNFWPWHLSLPTRHLTGLHAMPKGHIASMRWVFSIESRFWSSSREPQPRIRVERVDLVRGSGALIAFRRRRKKGRGKHFDSRAGHGRFTTRVTMRPSVLPVLP